VRIKRGNATVVKLDEIAEQLKARDLELEKTKSKP
jgi:hypothetical protein